MIGGKSFFIFFSNPYYGYGYAYRDIIALDNVIWIPSLPVSGNSFVRFLYKIHHSKRINRVFDIPFKDLWYRIPLRKFKHSSPVFIFNQLWSRSPVVPYVRKHFHNSKTVLQISDYKEGEAELSRFRVLFDQLFDLIVTYDKPQADKYAIDFYPNVHSYIDLSSFKVTDCSDIYFMGRAIDRLATIQGLVRLFVEKGKTCDIWLTNVDKKDQVCNNIIHYNRSMPYLEHLSHMASSKCVLYIQQGGAEAIEWRIILALLNNKRIITNVVSLMDYPFYDSSKIFILDDTSDCMSRLDDFLNDLDTPIEYRVQPQSFSPILLLDYIEHRVENEV